MTTTPLRNSDYAKLFIFSLLMLPTLFFAGLGVIPVVLLIYSIISAKDNRDFSRIETAVRYCCGYVLLSVIAILTVQIYWVLNSEPGLIPFIFLTITIGLVYAKVLNSLFLAPLALHRDWVAENGIFPNKFIAAESKQPNKGIAVRVIEQSSSLSAADELMKWMKLKNDGHITEEEFQEARKKFL